MGFRLNLGFGYRMSLFHALSAQVLFPCYFILYFIFNKYSENKYFIFRALVSVLLVKRFLSIDFDLYFTHPFVPYFTHLSFSLSHIGAMSVFSTHVSSFHLPSHF